MRQYKILSGIVFIFFLCAGWKYVGPPDIDFEIDSHDFGFVMQGKIIESVFDFSNKGKGRLIIEKVVTGGKHITAEISKKDLYWGHEGNITVHFDTNNIHGNQKEVVYVYTNDPDESVVPLTITGTVETEVDVEPDNLDFGVVPQGGSVTKNVSIMLNGENKISKVESSSPSVIARLLPHSDTAGNVMSVIISAVAPVGDLNETVSIHTVSGTKRVYSLDVSAQIVYDLQVTPEKIMFIRSAAGNTAVSLVRTVSAWSQSDEIFAITGIVCSPDLMNITILPKKKASRYVLTISLESDIDPDTPGGEIQIMTDRKEQKNIIIPFQILQ